MAWASVVAGDAILAAEYNNLAAALETQLNTSGYFKSQVPASASATGTTGTITWDASYIYVCTATNTWKRIPISTW